MKFHKHDYAVFVESHLIASGMEKAITRKCSICGKCATKNSYVWCKWFARRNHAKQEESK